MGYVSVRTADVLGVSGRRCRMNIVCGRYPGSVLPGSQVLLPCVTDLPRRRYLVIQTHVMNGALNFCEIDVFVNSKKLFILCVVLSSAS